MDPYTPPQSQIIEKNYKPNLRATIVCNSLSTGATVSSGLILFNYPSSHIILGATALAAVATKWAAYKTIPKPQENYKLIKILDTCSSISFFAMSLPVPLAMIPTLGIIGIGLKRLMYKNIILPEKKGSNSRTNSKA